MQQDRIEELVRDFQRKHRSVSTFRGHLLKDRLRSVLECWSVVYPDHWHIIEEFLDRIEREAGLSTLEDSDDYRKDLENWE